MVVLGTVSLLFTKVDDFTYYYLIIPEKFSFYC